MNPNHENNTSFVAGFQSLDSDDVAAVGGKNASLGEMLKTLQAEGIRVPDGFATTASAYRRFLEHNALQQPIKEQLAELNDNGDNLVDIGAAIRDLFESAEFPSDLVDSIEQAYHDLSSSYDQQNLDVAVRSSATAEDLPEASFAGQQETFLNICGVEALLNACRHCFASLFTDRAIAYREDQGFDHMAVALSVGIQKMVRADEAGAGVAFTIDSETGFRDVVVINANWGLGETVVAGTVNPDEYRVFKPLLKNDEVQPIIEKTLGTKKRMVVYSDDADQPTQTKDTEAKQRERFVLSDAEILQLAKWCTTIEQHYDRPMDIEWARDGVDEQLYIVQARPETVQSQQQSSQLRSDRLKEDGDVLAEGLAIGSAIAAGKAFVLESPDQSDRFEDGGVLVTDMTDPDWGPLMERASAIVTDHGGRTSHAAIVSRELGIPAVIGTANATKDIDEGQEVTVSCATGEIGRVYDGILDYESQEIDISDVPETETDLMLILASPDAAMQWWNLPVRGVGLTRLEFVINNIIQIHPLALARFDEVEDDQARQQIEELTRGYDDKPQYFIDHLSRGIAKIAAAFHPHDVIVRMSDFKSNEYANLIGGTRFEPDEENPMLGFRGASRYRSDEYAQAFAMECAAIRMARETIGLSNIVVMVPFCRSVEEADAVLSKMAEHGLVRGRAGLRVYVMAEIPANITLANQFAQRFDGFSIGTNDLTQLVLGVDRDSQQLSDVFDERNEAVKQVIASLIDHAHEAGRPVGICGQAPSDHPEFADFLISRHIDSISVNPDRVVDVLYRMAEAEQKRKETES